MTESEKWQAAVAEMLGEVERLKKEYASRHEGNEPTRWSQKAQAASVIHEALRHVLIRHGLTLEERE